MKYLVKASILIMMSTLLSFSANTAAAQERSNPFFEDWDAIPYRIPPFSRIQDADYIPALQEGIRQQNQTIANIVQNTEEPTFQNTVLALDNSGDLMEKVCGVLFNIVEAQSTDELREIQTEALALLSEQNDRVYMNAALFNRIKSLKDKNPSLDPIQTKLLNDVYRDFVLCGAELNEADQEELKRVNLKLSELENTFSDNLLKATADYELFVSAAHKARLEGLPEDDLQRAFEKAKAKGRDGYIFGLDNPTVMPFLQYVKDGDLRRQILVGYTSRCQAGTPYDNTETVRRIVNLRLRKAQLLGFPDFATYALQTRMAQTPENAYKLMKQVWYPAHYRAKEELAEMKKYRRENEAYTGTFIPSEWRYYANLVKESKYALDENEVREYFSVDNVREGIFYLCNRLYGITFVKFKDVEVPTPNTTGYLCKDANGSVLGVLYLDMIARPGFKAGGAWNTNYVEQAYDARGKRLNPVTSIVCNYTPAVGDKPTLLNIDETQTFFHEFGHALNMLFSEVKYKGLNRIPTDFVELPSQIMEHWAMHPLMLKQYAKHYKTGKPMPKELIDRIQRVLNYGQGFALTELLAAAMLDMDYHTIKEPMPDLDPAAFERQSCGKLGLMLEILPRYRTNYFAHTMGGNYSAGYYSYTWAEVLDCDAFEAFVKSGDIFNKNVAASFRNNILKNGAMYPPMDMFVKFRGHEPDVKALLKSRGLLE